jgi:hypothetical protein
MCYSMTTTLIDQYVEWIYLDKADQLVFILCRENPDYKIRTQLIRQMPELHPYMTYKIVWRSYYKCMTSAFQLTGPLIKKFLLGQIETVYNSGNIVEHFTQYLDIVGHSTIWTHIILHDMTFQHENTWKYVIVLLHIIMDKPYRDLLEDLYVTVEHGSDRWLTVLSTILDEIDQDVEELQYIRILLGCNLRKVGHPSHGHGLGHQLRQSVRNLMHILVMYDDNTTLQGLIDYNFWKDQLGISSPSASTS